MIDRLFWLLFSFRGRIGRAIFASVFFTQLAVNWIYQFTLLRRYMVVTYDAAHKAKVGYDAPPSVIGVALFLVALSAWISFANHIKRLHDFGWSGWWLVAPIGGAVIGGVLAGLFAALHFVAGLVLAGLVAVVAVVGSLVLLVMMFFRAGDAGENGHPRGPDDEAPEHRDLAPAPSLARLGRPGAAQGFGRRGVRT